MKLHPILSLIVPRDWNGEDALTAVNILAETIQAIWFVHGDDMEKCTNFYDSSNPARFPQNHDPTERYLRQTATEARKPPEDLPF